MGELLPVVSNEKNGLVDKNLYQSFPKDIAMNSIYLKLIQHSTMGAWNTTFIDILAVQGLGDNPGRIVISISSDGGYDKAIRIFKTGNPSVKILKDSQFIYIQRTCIYRLIINVSSTNNFPLILESLSEVPADATEVQ